MHSVTLSRLEWELIIISLRFSNRFSNRGFGKLIDPIRFQIEEGEN